MLYKNNRYEVTLPEGGTEYLVTNSETGVVEYRSEQLPKCIIVAQESEAALKRLMPEEGGDETNIVRLR